MSMSWHVSISASATPGLAAIGLAGASVVSVETDKTHP
jgi:hypothetical protein